MRNYLKLLIIPLLIIASTSLLGEQTQSDILSVELVSSRDAAIAGEALDVALIVDINHPWHVYAPKGNDEFTIPISPEIKTDGL